MTLSRFPARCGSTDPAHRTGKCQGCKQIYNRRYRQHATTRPPAECVICGLLSGNSLNIHVRQYALIRTATVRGKKKTSVCIGSIGLCNRCVRDYGRLNGKVRLTESTRTVDDGLRAHDTMPVAVGS